jgi:hypothetical protein
LNIPRLNIEQKYSSIFLQYGEEVEEIGKVMKDTLSSTPVLVNLCHVKM